MRLSSRRFWHRTRGRGAAARGTLRARLLAGQPDPQVIVPYPAEGSHPAEHLPIALTGRGEALRSENKVTFIDDCRDVRVLMGIDAADHMADPIFLGHWVASWFDRSSTASP